MSRTRASAAAGAVLVALLAAGCGLEADDRPVPVPPEELPSPVDGSPP